MTIKIIKKGKPPSHLYEGKCGNCGCEFLCNEDDLTPHEDTRQLEDTYYSIRCPTLGCNCIVNPKRKRT